MALYGTSPRVKASALSSVSMESAPRRHVFKASLLLGVAVSRYLWMGAMTELGQAHVTSACLRRSYQIILMPTSA